MARLATGHARGRQSRRFSATRRLSDVSHSDAGPSLHRHAGRCNLTALCYPQTIFKSSRSETVTHAQAHCSLVAARRLNAATEYGIRVVAFVTVIHGAHVQIGTLGNLVVGHGDESLRVAHALVAALELICRAQIPQC